MDFYNKYLDTARKLKNVQLINQSKIRELEKEIQRLKIQIINPKQIPQYDRELIKILSAVSESSMITQSDIIGLSRQRSVAVVRFCFMYIAHESGFTLSEIGRFLNRHHSTVIHGVRAFEKFIEIGYKYECRVYQEAKKYI
jgi:chromosomal replication initiation ATPase DnaA